ncbi:phage tail assembly chaperone [Rhizobium sp. LjRoot30]|uniref:rcc01693 family protein n=1 Tax=Rhizobium sp. LjRoot30 TaxID=3342320 RepID=UPI003ECC62C0
MSAGAAARPFPWDEALHAGFCLLRLEPRVFWTMTPREFHAALGGLRGRGQGLRRETLEALMEAFPDGDGAGSERRDHGRG